MAPFPAPPHPAHSNALRALVVQCSQAGFLYAGEAGTGLCVARLPNGDWSAPAAVQTFGLSWGFQAGCEVTICEALCVGADDVWFAVCLVQCCGVVLVSYVLRFTGK